MVDPVGASLGVAGILLAFKGVVDSTNLIDSILASDNGSQFLAMRYRVERQRTDVWGAEVRISDPDTPLLRESASTRRLITGILAELRATHDLALKYLKRYGLSLVHLDSKVAEEVNSIESDAVKNIESQRKEQKQKSVFRWATKDKAKFTDLVDRMKSLNDSLDDLVRLDHTQALATALSAYLIPQIQDTVSLTLLQTSKLDINPMLVLSARLKQLQLSPLGDSSQEALYLKSDKDFVFEHSTDPGHRITGYVTIEDEPQRAWVEWKRVARQADESTKTQILQRVAVLQVVLSTARPREFRIPPCLGLLTGLQGHHHNDIGIVYSWPENSDTSQNPANLLELLEAEDDDMPMLDDRYAMAYALASALSLFHASKWLHRGFRSDNILFFKDHSGKLLLQNPYISGFEYSRQQGQVSNELRQTGDPRLDLYYHPDVPYHGFNEVRDIYSLGVVLFEIAFWKPLSVLLPEEVGQPLDKIPLAAIRTFLLDSEIGLGGQVGSSYGEAVMRCISGDFAVNSAGGDENPALGPDFFVKVVKKLGHCRA